ncbi:prolipoprotein diacylglyceryl transferase [Bacillus sp. GM2]|jgi:phosphatidylglycerol:prolipoprotein diacylglycerol transferase|uniref:Phosphatidylglycerol--prolipoprotein diacylglyceryl transferase n=1 Tax=Bacillus paralicheniformis TaxID=1648923 RepID=A0AAW6K5U8_9BACI|nr:MULTISPECIES: prolipoprotein diacylglyceryl transferase [Bacillus]ETB71707.1 prolipoprotein diacylglyceryl transferase [Bacillus sp. CPSM8]KJD54542.1 diacylglyceryl transferase [Bacillus amyloliquefaciens]KUL13859.1 prolipoprotein diacylglyceryl transferase [Bacillus licheniformis LMG 7559]MBC8621485.1 prolipoprotein diacylglyceryl transferase [Robertmurraya crescens]POO81379.1 prolipoprotein diacylglyceryl transferase [Bacillus sp. MBGLi97]
MNETIEPLNPIAFHLGPIAVHWYGIIIGLGALLGLWLAVREGERRGLHKDTFVDLVLFAIPIAILCARAYYVIFQWGYYSEHPDQIIQIWNGGLAIHGGLIGAVLTGIIYAKVKGLSFWKLADIAAPSILLGQAIGRWGNFMNQEAHGEAVSRAFLENLHLPDFIINQMYIDGQYYQPTFLYESLWSFTGVVVLLLLRKANLKRGELFLIYVIWYSMGRYYIEGLRTDSLMLTANLRIAQVISIVLILSAAALIAYRRFKGREIKRYQEM